MQVMMLIQRSAGALFGLLFSVWLLLELVDMQFTSTEAGNLANNNLEGPIPHNISSCTALNQFCGLLVLYDQPTTTRLFIPNASNRKKSIPNKSPPSPKSTPEIEAISQKKFPGRSKDERPNSIADGNSGRSNTGRSQSTAFKSFGVQKKDTKGFLLDLKDQQVETGNLQDATFLNAVAKLGLGSVLRGPLEDAKTDAVTPRLNCQLQSCPIELLHPPEDCNVNSSLSFTLQICRVENILVEGRIEGSVVHFHRPRTIAIDSLGAISASGMGMFRVYDVDTQFHNLDVKMLKLDEQQFLGEATCTLSQIVTKSNGLEERPLQNRWSNEELMLATGTGGVTRLRHDLKLYSAYLGVHVWDLVTGRLLQTRAFSLPITAIVVDPTEMKLFSGGIDY
ncbi:Protein BONZAI 2 [Camellia lanceoleosa]|uniref:Protein BONZAI 2 n=1 Tax=Camellia lanceoleosa TaxID=1840588 RepID=A0ACC0GN82_9ERIC|nr:Protein BONZAI 2 [Camellia lanceoleosa]